MYIVMYIGALFWNWPILQLHICQLLYEFAGFVKETVQIAKQLNAN